MFINLNAIEMSRDDLVRGRKRQRRRTPKTKTGCNTCKVRRVKCDKEKPSCLRCKSTGRQCDFITTPDAKSRGTEVDPGLVQPKILQASTNTGTVNGVAEPGEDRVSSRSPDQLTNQNSVLSIPVCTFRTLPIPASMSRAFEYFLRRTSTDLPDPTFCISTWGHYILRVATNSPPVQHTIAALSRIHECQNSSKNSSPKADLECWKHYYLAVKATNKLVTDVQVGSGNGNSSKEELLVLCTSFITIEVLLGNFESALRHLQGFLSLLQMFRSGGAQTSENSGISSASQEHLDSRLADLIGFIVRLEIQILSFLPRKRNPARIPTGSSLPPVVPLQPLPSVMSESLHRLIKQSLVWICDYGSAFKYARAIPDEMIEAQAELIGMLDDWKLSHRASPKNLEKTMDPKDANLLLAHQLTYLKVQTALSASEHVFSTPSSLASFKAVLECSSIIIEQRNTSPGKEGNFAQLVSFFSLEMTTVEALYFTAIKCRQSDLRHRAVELLNRAGREGVWDGNVMAVIAKHVISVEEEDEMSSSSSSEGSTLGNDASPYSSVEESFLPLEFDNAFAAETSLNTFLTSSPQRMHPKELINEVTFSIDQDKSTVQVKCSWYSNSPDAWRSESAILSLLN